MMSDMGLVLLRVYMSECRVSTLSMFHKLSGNVILMIMENIENDMNVVEIWLRRDLIRWIAGAMAGIFAGAVAMAVAMFFASIGGWEIWFPLKLMGSIVLGPYATEIGMNTKAIVVGVVVYGGISTFLGVLFAHFTGTNALCALLGIGFVWGSFSWIFIWNLFMQSFDPIFVARISSTTAFPICMAFGFALASVAFFDRAMRGSRT